MNEVSSIKSVKDYDFSKYAEPPVTQAIRDYWNNDCLTDAQQDLILEEYEHFANSKTPEESFFSLATRELDFAQDQYPYERMVGLFKLSGYAGESTADIDTFVHIVCYYPDDFGCNSNEIIDELKDSGRLDDFSDEIELLEEYFKMAQTLDREYLAFGAALDWICQLIQKGELTTKE
jgi:hypothetical protein